jgi:hypothetical protein
LNGAFITPVILRSRANGALSWYQIPRQGGTVS